MGEVWKYEFERASWDENRKKEKNCLGNDNTKAEVQMLAAKKVTERESNSNVQSGMTVGSTDAIHFEVKKYC